MELLQIFLAVCGNFAVIYGGLWKFYMYFMKFE